MLVFRLTSRYVMSGHVTSLHHLFVFTALLRQAIVGQAPVPPHKEGYQMRSSPAFFLSFFFFGGGRVAIILIHIVSQLSILVHMDLFLFF